MLTLRPRWKRILQAPVLFVQHYQRCRWYADPWDAVVIAYRFTKIAVR